MLYILMSKFVAKSAVGFEQYCQFSVEICDNHLSSIKTMK